MKTGLVVLCSLVIWGGLFGFFGDIAQSVVFAGAALGTAILTIEAIGSCED